MQRTPKSLLLRISQDGDRTAWPEFVTILVPAMTAWTRKLPVRLHDNDAEELIQSILVELWRMLPGFHYDESKSFRRLLQKMLHDRSMDLLRQKHRHRGASLDEVQDPEHLNFPTLEHKEVRSMMLHQVLEIVRTELSETTCESVLGTLYSRTLSSGNRQEVILVSQWPDLNVMVNVASAAMVAFAIVCQSRSFLPDLPQMGQQNRAMTIENHRGLV
jgi:DNA-directed RNA polymerase specialized sigma24 family protein